MLWVKLKTGGNVLIFGIKNMVTRSEKRIVPIGNTQLGPEYRWHSRSAYNEGSYSNTVLGPDAGRYL